MHSVYSPQPFAQPSNLTPSHHFCSFPATTPTITVQPQPQQASFPHHSHIAQQRPETIALDALDHHHHHPATASPSIHITPLGHAAASAAAAAAAVAHATQMAQMRAGPHIFLQADVNFVFVFPRRDFTNFIPLFQNRAHQGVDFVRRRNIPQIPRRLRFWSNSGAPPTRVVNTPAVHIQTHDMLNSGFLLNFL